MIKPEDLGCLRWRPAACLTQVVDFGDELHVGVFDAVVHHLDEVAGAIRADVRAARGAAGFGVGTATAWRYVEETIALLAARAPKLRTAVRDIKKAGWAYVIVDGTLIPVDRVAADRPFYSGKHQRHGMNLQVIASPHGDVLWVSGALPGSVHDMDLGRAGRAGGRRAGHAGR